MAASNERVREVVEQYLRLVATGTADEIAGSTAELGRIIPGSKVLDIPNRDHMRAVGDKVYKTGVLEFLSQRK